MAGVLCRLLTALLLSMLAVPAGAQAVDPDDPAAQWLPRSDGAEWEYAWRDSVHAPEPRRERYWVSSRSGRSFRISWQEVGVPAEASPGAGFADYDHADAGLVNTNYQASQPPRRFPVLCPSAAQCGNSMAGTHFMLFWGTRSPVLAEPLVRGTRWSALGGAENDVASANRYVGRERVTVPAFPQGVSAAKVVSDVTQAGALGDPYGSGTRTVWWVYGVGPVKVEFRHTGGEVGSSELQRTSLAPRRLPDDASYFPLDTGATADYRWRNSKHMRSWSRQRFTVGQVLNNTARFDVKHLSGPIAVAGSHVLASRLTGVTAINTTVKGATRARFPRLAKGTSGRRRFTTPFDLMNFGFNPVLPAHPAVGDTWRSSRDSRDWDVYGVTGVSKVVGRRTVRTPAGRFRKTLVVRSTLRQKGHPFGSGTRTSYFAPGKGLVRLVFEHADGSTSTVERTR